VYCGRLTVTVFLYLARSDAYKHLYKEMYKVAMQEASAYMQWEMKFVQGVALASRDLRRAAKVHQ